MKRMEIIFKREPKEYVGVSQANDNVFLYVCAHQQWREEMKFPN